MSKRRTVVTSLTIALGTVCMLGRPGQTVSVRRLDDHGARF